MDRTANDFRPCKYCRTNISKQATICPICHKRVRGANGCTRILLIGMLGVLGVWAALWYVTGI